ncbi:Uncharacterised protein [Streptococcus pyogenes]|nr:Uncharacterised protein [Streptococcus pyogenes]
MKTRIKTLFKASNPLLGAFERNLTDGTTGKGKG